MSFIQPSPQILLLAMNDPLVYAAVSVWRSEQGNWPDLLERLVVVMAERHRRMEKIAIEAAMRSPSVVIEKPNP